jgi:hypothetical protein
MRRDDQAAIPGQQGNEGLLRRKPAAAVQEEERPPAPGLEQIDLDAG